MIQATRAVSSPIWDFVSVFNATEFCHFFFFASIPRAYSTRRPSMYHCNSVVYSYYTALTYLIAITEARAEKTRLPNASNFGNFHHERLRSFSRGGHIESLYRHVVRRILQSHISPSLSHISPFLASSIKSKSVCGFQQIFIKVSRFVLRLFSHQCCLDVETLKFTNFREYLAIVFDWSRAFLRLAS